MSVRENNSRKWLEDLGINNISIMPDPTLLFEKGEWIEKFHCEEPLVSGKYINYYGFRYNHEENIVVQSLSEKLGLPVYVVDARKYSLYNLKKYGFKTIKNGGPLAFVNLMAHCTVSLTLSFHGTVFSSLFEKPFFYLRKPNISSDDDRASFLMEQLGLTSQDMKLNNVLEQSDRLFNIDYEKVNAKTNILRKNAFNFFENNIVN
ncbi:polysaccharide pyruvyl transferase family protein [Enterococcus casseliflavus]|uniref:polysaccharide pyruvyl transferase family protein n=1 Tax=Enterococcus casseliflavus TaxID=37734 RepID=UPI001919D837|nr:polysaccharide pyruvyl transferase family protein [Enterococcus casseliflavus]QQU15548.1 polysaccharide pyruvyl transferase family protein [Enterococcus casseliflavus]